MTLLSPGPPLARTESLLVTVNWRGVILLEERVEKTLLELPYIEIKDINIERYRHPPTPEPLSPNLNRLDTMLSFSGRTVRTVSLHSQ